VQLVERVVQPEREHRLVELSPNLFKFKKSRA
jgi:hypothetical protein